MTGVTPLGVGCTYCGARDGVPCETRNGTLLSTFHGARLDLAAHWLDPCSCLTCNGSGVLVDCHGGSCSHVNDREYPCPACETAREVGPEPEEGL